MPLLGNPDPSLSDTDPAAIQMRFACLGAVGPDIFYAMADYGGDLQDLENVLVKIAGTFECVSELLGKVDRYVSGLESSITLGVVDEIKQTFGLVSGVMSESMLALFASGVNLWPVFEPARQRDQPRNGGTGPTTCTTSAPASSSAPPRQEQAATRTCTRTRFGYLTHYVTDVVGHPYVNQVVGAPWRLHWQRHHLVENFMDAYVWDRWHAARRRVTPPPPPPRRAAARRARLDAEPDRRRRAVHVRPGERLDEHRHDGCRRPARQHRRERLHEDRAGSLRPGRRREDRPTRPDRCRLPGLDEADGGVARTRPTTSRRRCAR